MNLIESTRTTISSSSSVMASDIYKENTSHSKAACGVKRRGPQTKTKSTTGKVESKKFDASTTQPAEGNHSNNDCSTPKRPKSIHVRMLQHLSTTPMPDFDAMDDAKLNKELDRYGLRPVCRSKAIRMLSRIYDATHPVISKSTPLQQRVERALIRTQKRPAAVARAEKAREKRIRNALAKLAPSEPSNTATTSKEPVPQTTSTTSNLSNSDLFGAVANEESRRKCFESTNSSERADGLRILAGKDVSCIELLDDDDDVGNGDGNYGNGARLIGPISPIDLSDKTLNAFDMSDDWFREMEAEYIGETSYIEVLNATGSRSMSQLTRATSPAISHQASLTSGTPAAARASFSADALLTGAAITTKTGLSPETLFHSSAENVMTKKATLQQNQPFKENMDFLCRTFLDWLRAPSNEELYYDLLSLKPIHFERLVTDFGEHLRVQKISRAKFADLLDRLHITYCIPKRDGGHY